MDDSLVLKIHESVVSLNVQRYSFSSVTIKYLFSMLKPVIIGYKHNALSNLNQCGATEILEEQKFDSEYCHSHRKIKICETFRNFKLPILIEIVFTKHQRN